jgi:glyoxylase-like metal-dependent hydrolase (beta-lactamase superfamily II)
VSVPDLPLAGDWFQIVPGDHGPGVTALTEPHVDRFIRCNLWLVSGRDADLLIDSGLGLVSLAGSLPELFRGRRTIAVATHYHFDHVGSFHEFPERLIHRLEAAIVSDGAAIGGRLRTTGLPASAIEMLESVGYAMPADGELLTALPAAGYDPDGYAVTGAEPTRLLDEGDVIDLGDRQLEVLHLPGHSPGSIGLWEEASATLFSGDALYDGPLLDFADDSDIDDYVTTMERLLRIPALRVHGGHEPSFGPERLRQLCDAYLSRHR